MGAHKATKIGHSPRIWWSELWAKPAIYEAARCLWCALIEVASYVYMLGGAVVGWFSDGWGKV